LIKFKATLNFEKDMQKIKQALHIRKRKSKHKDKKTKEYD